MKTKTFTIGDIVPMNQVHGKQIADGSRVIAQGRVSTVSTLNDNIRATAHSIESMIRSHVHQLLEDMQERFRRSLKLSAAHHNRRYKKQRTLAIELKKVIQYHLFNGVCYQLRIEPKGKGKLSSDYISFPYRLDIHVVEPDSVNIEIGSTVISNQVYTDIPLYSNEADIGSMDFMVRVNYDSQNKLTVVEPVLDNGGLRGRKYRAIEEALIASFLK